MAPPFGEVKYLRTGLSWADSFRSHALDWFDRGNAGAGGVRRYLDLLLHSGRAVSCPTIPAHHSALKSSRSFVFRWYDAMAAMFDAAAGI